MSRESNTPVELPRYASVKSAAELLDVNPTTVRRWIAQGVLSAVRIGSTTLRVDLASLKTSPVGAAVAA